MITARPNHRPTRQECLLNYMFGNRACRKCFLSIFLTSSFQTHKLAITHKTRGRKSNTRGAYSLGKEYTPLPQRVQTLSVAEVMSFLPEMVVLNCSGIGCSMMSSPSCAENVGWFHRTTFQNNLPESQHSSHWIWLRQSQLQQIPTDFSQLVI